MFLYLSVQSSSAARLSQGSNRITAMEHARQGCLPVFSREERMQGDRRQSCPSVDLIFRRTVTAARRHGFCVDDAEDCAADLRLRLLGRAGRITAHCHPGETCEQCVYFCVHDHVKNYVRGRQRELCHLTAWPELANRDGDTYPADIRAKRPSPDDLLLRLEFRRLAFEAIGRLTPDQRTVFLARLHGGSHNEIGAFMQRTPQAVAQLYHAARIRLRAQLDEAELRAHLAPCIHGVDAKSAR
jgi:DNA-directed RNA polymerase specialized sigma24 family protein